MRYPLMIALAAVLVANACAAWAQVSVSGVPTSGEETLTVSTAAKTITANLCGPGNQRTAVAQVLTNAINFSLHGAGTPDTGDFYAGTLQYISVRPASALRMVRNGGTDASVKVNCFE